MDKTAEQLSEDIKGLQQRIADASEKLSAGALNADDQKAVTDQVTELANQVEPLIKEHREAVAAESQKALETRLQTLEDATKRALDAGRIPTPLPFGASEGAKAVYGPEGETSLYRDVALANPKKGMPDAKAIERLEEAEQLDIKAMGEGIAAEGGFLVPTDVRNELIGLRDRGGVARALFSQTSTTVDEVEFMRQDTGLAVAWTAEFAEKLKTDMTFSSFSARVFTAAGLCVVSNQLLADAKWPLDRMINTDFAKRFVWLEENAFFAGDGVNQPLGLYNTPGVDSVPVKAGESNAATALSIMDAIQDAITGVYTDFYAAPNAIVMHPTTWAFLVKQRESATSATYLIGSGSTLGFGRTANDPIPGYGPGPLPRGELHGVPVYTTPAVPSNLGDAENETCVFVGDFNQGLIMDRQGITTDNSKHVYFETNQTVFRSEERLGFTAGRYPNAFKVVEGDAFAGI